MDLDEMKAVWSDLGSQLETQKRLTQDVILKMTQEKSNSRLGRIIAAESIGIGVCLIVFVYLILNFHKLEHWTSAAGGVGLLLILILGVVFATKIISKARGMNILEHTYAETIQRFDDFRALLRKYKKLSYWTSGFSMLFAMAVTTELFLGKNLMEVEGLGFSLLVAVVLVPLILRLFVRFYSKNVSEVKKALKDIDFKD